MMPKIIRKLSHSVKTRIIAGGLISDRESVMAALDAGACGVSSTVIRCGGCRKRLRNDKTELLRQERREPDR